MAHPTTHPTAAPQASAHPATGVSRRQVLGSAALTALAVVGTSARAADQSLQTAIQAATLPDLGAAPDFTDIERWLNTEALSLARLRGRVVLVDFWTYACVNCIRTLPHVNQWAATYAAHGLTVVGVHTPEFPFERATANVEAAMRRHGVQHAVAQDNRYGTWKAYDNQYWPATYLIDAKGRIRYKHFGEGDYERTEHVIRALLADRNRGAALR